MRIPLRYFRDTVTENDPSSVFSLIHEMVEQYTIETVEAIAHYVIMCKILNVEHLDIMISDWDSNSICLREDSLETVDGDYITPDDRDHMGATCYMCDNIYHHTSGELSPYVNSSDDTYLVCSDCADNESLYWNEERNTYYVDRQHSDRLNRRREQVTNRDDLVFTSASDLYYSYSSGSSQRLVPQKSEEVQLVLLNYSANPIDYRQAFLFDENENLPISPLWLGVELECNPNDTGVKTKGFFYKVASTVNKFAIIKSDGSLDSGGMEIVSTPATLNKHRALWSDFFEKAAPLLKSWSTGKCGMHVHLSKAFFSELEIGRALVFINSDENRKFIELVAGRKANQFTALQPKSYRDVRRGEHRHYDALSISGHTHGKTLELRIFRGNVSVDGFFKNLEFADAMAHFVKQASARQLRAQDFLVWLSSPQIRGQYPFLIAWAVKHKLFNNSEGKPIKVTVAQKAKELTFAEV